jgi:hypothetical protein
VALTGHALAGHADGAREAGCDAFVTKPCLPDELVAEIRRMLAGWDPRPRGRTLDRARPTDISSTGTDKDCHGQGETPGKTKGARRPAAKPTRARKAAPKARPAERPARNQPAHGRRRLERVRLPAEPARSRPRPLRDPNAGKYVYCIVQSERPLSFGPLGIGSDPAEVHTVHYRDIAAVVSDTPMVVQDPTRDNVLAHQRVNETVMRDHTVIPMSFGTVFKTDDDIIELLRSAYDAFRDVLTKMEDKFEFGLKVLWDREQIIREIETEDEDIRRLKGEISSQKGSTYFARMQYGRLIDARCRRAPSATWRRSSRRCATSRSPRDRTSRSATG